MKIQVYLKNIVFILENKIKLEFTFYYYDIIE